jgi:Mrp family chromosome partitioning ATPase
LVQSLPNDVNSARANVEALTQRLLELKKQAADADGARARLTTLTDDATAARNVYTAFTDQLRQTDAAMAYNAADVRVLSRAVTPIRASFPDQMIMLPAGLIIALMASCMTAYLTTQQKGLSGTYDIETLFGEHGIEGLGLIPIRTPRTIHHFETAIEQILNKLLILEPRPKSILITSALPEEGKSTTARALAEAALKRDMKVFLVDADMRSKPRLSGPSMGLGDVLRGDADIEDVVTRRMMDDTEQRRLPMLPAGTPRGNPTSLMAKPLLGVTVDRLKAEYDLVFVDAPPALIGGDCEMLARVVDTTVMLAKWHSTPPETVALALKQLGKKADIAGMVLTMVDPGQIRLYGQADAVLFDKKISNYYRS